jgi:geranylgeranyl reductase family protein
MDSQVIIVGAGPAGASAAVALAQAGVRDVRLLDRDRFPRDKTCGSGLSPAALQLAEQLGIGAELRARANPVQWVRFVTPGNQEMVMPAHGAAVILLRKEFDNLLVDRARALGVRVEEGFRAVELIRDGRRAVGVKSFDGRQVSGRFVLCADGAHSIFSPDRRPRRHISTLMGWWENAELRPGQLDMIFDRRVAPLYGWMFPETPSRVNIGICLDAQDAQGRKVERNLRSEFYQFIEAHYGQALRHARQVGTLKGHPIAFTTWVSNCTAPGALWVGEAARVTHNATGEGISQAMQAGIYAAQAVASVLRGERSERSAWRHYLWQHRRRFTAGFVAGHLVRAVVSSSLLDRIAKAYNSAFGQRMIQRLLGSALTGTISQGAPVPPLGDGSSQREH